MINNKNEIVEINGKKVIVINNVKYRSKYNIPWGNIEDDLKRMVGKTFIIDETCERVGIEADFPDEFCHSKDKIKLKGAYERAKANLSTVISEVIRISTQKIVIPDYHNKHGRKAKNGWHRYLLRFAIPSLELNENYNFFKADVLVRHTVNDNLYLYDIVRIKKETSGPLRAKS